LKWEHGDDSDKTFAVAILDDSDYEGDEAFNLTLENATGGTTINDPDTATVAIADDDQISGTLQFSDVTYSLDEGEGAVAITVTRVGGSFGTASVKVVTSSCTADNGEDYEKTSKTLKWDDGEVGDKTFTVDILDDSKVEGDATK
jgi:hypothetical protein